MFYPILHQCTSGDHLSYQGDDMGLRQCTEEFSTTLVRSLASECKVQKDHYQRLVEAGAQLLHSPLLLPLPAKIKQV